jgi:hypothetical protein
LGKSNTGQRAQANTNFEKPSLEKLVLPDIRTKAHQAIVKR